MELAPGINVLYGENESGKIYHTYIYPLHVLRRSQTAGKGCSERYIYKSMNHGKNSGRIWWDHVVYK